MLAQQVPPVFTAEQPIASHRARRPEVRGVGVPVQGKWPRVWVLDQAFARGLALVAVRAGPGVRARPEGEAGEGRYVEGGVVGVELGFERGDGGGLVDAEGVGGVGVAVAVDYDGFD